MTFESSFVTTIIIISSILLFGILSLVRFLRKVEQGKALIKIPWHGEPVVTFTGALILPIIHKAEIMDISLKTLEIERRGREGLICKDNIRADIKVAFFVGVNKTTQDVLQVAQSIGCDRASYRETLEELFMAKFSEALKTVGKKMDFEDLYKEREMFRDRIKEEIGGPSALGGYVLHDAAIDFLEQTPLTALDENNILDSQGIRKITELTTGQNVRTNELRNQEKMTRTQQNVKAREAILELERQQADAEAKQAREVKNVQVREQAEMEVVASEEHFRSEQARIRADEQIAIQQENKTREIEVAQQNRARVVGIETERVKLAREQEVIAREREIELQRISKEKALEEQRRDIAQVIRERISVERTVAEEEERIKELRQIEEANRAKKVIIINAEAKAQETLVTDIKAAEASHEASKFRIQEQLASAEAEREVSDKKSAAKIRLAEGIQAEQAATGLAEVKVKEANALALEKQGIAEARAMLEKMQAEASGAEQKGLAQVRVKEANILTIEKEGIATAKASLEKMQAEATGEEQKGLAQVRIKEANAEAMKKQGLAEVEVKEADAMAIEKQGLAEVHIREANAQAIEKEGFAEAKALQERLIAEATGLAEKFKSLDALSEKGREHEEFRLQLEQHLEVKRLTLSTQKIIAEKQAQILAEALKSAKIDIVGGDNLFFERIIEATSVAKMVDSFVDKSDTTQRLLKDYLEGDENLVKDVKEVLSNPAISSQDIQNLTLSAFLSKLVLNSAPENKTKLSQLQKLIKKMELEDVKLLKGVEEQASD
jgi:uncharacterized membrane protein YqiK